MRRFSLVMTVALAAGLLLAACGDDDSAPDKGAPSGSSPGVQASASARASSGAGRSPTPITPGPTPTPNPVHATADGMALGSKTAKVTIAVYEDFQCPFCLAYTQSLEPTILKEYVATGKVRYEFHNLPILGIESVAAAVAVACAADQNRFWPFHDRLYKVESDAGQAQKEQLNVGRFGLEQLKALAADVGLDTAAFNDCFQNAKTLPAVQADYESAVNAGLNGTPGFIVNGKVMTNAPGTTQEWRTLIDGLLK